MGFIISAVMFRGRASLGNATIRAAWHWALLTVQRRGARDMKGVKAGTGKGQKQLRLVLGVPLLALLLVDGDHARSSCELG